jgi:hypothetical protein
VAAPGAQTRYVNPRFCGTLGYALGLRANQW